MTVSYGFGRLELQAFCVWIKKKWEKLSLHLFTLPDYRHAFQ